MVEDGFLNLLKPPGMTSHDVVALVRRQLGQRRVGHLGTLDPAAAGVLPVAVGRTTRLADIAGHAGKCYRALIVLGVTTDTLDGEGTVTSTADAGAVREGQVRAALAGMLGEQEQVPPAYSAVRVGGKRLHALARQGRAVVPPPRRVRFARLDLLEFRPGVRASALVDIACSAGTYVRVLAADLGRAAGPGAYLEFLLRTAAGRFALPEAVTLEEFAAAPAAGLLPPDWPLVGLPQVALTAAEAAAFAAGARQRVPTSPARHMRVYRGDRFLGLGEVTPEGWLHPRLVLAAPGEVDRCA
jgi:tRNA pseudouridine55 synthase